MAAGRKESETANWLSLSVILFPPQKRMNGSQINPTRMEATDRRALPGPLPSTARRRASDRELRLAMARVRLELNEMYCADNSRMSNAMAKVNIPREAQIAGGRSSDALLVEVFSFRMSTMTKTTAPNTS
jgi:hypothetical protein